MFAVKERAPKFFHDVRQTWLYEDYDYCGGVQTIDTDVATERVYAEQKVKAKAKPKGAATGKRRGLPFADDTVPLKKLRRKDHRLLEQLQAKAAKAREETDAAIAQDPKHNVPAPIRDALCLKTAELDVMHSDIDMVAKDEHSELDIATTAKKTTALLKEHALQLKGFLNVQKAMHQAQ